MSSLYNNNLATLLKKIELEINKYSEMNQTEIFNQSVNRLLKYTLHKYNNSIDQLSDYLLNQEGMRVLKAITKTQKFSDKKIIRENMKGEEDDKYSK